MRALIVMGVSGAGKSAVSQATAARLGWRYVDADDLHPLENIAKMANGTPLTDADRWPWLDAVREAMIRAEGPLVVACSALKRAYRERLHQGDEGIRFVYLKGSYDLICERMKQREDHFFEPEMLRSQFDTLEEPDPDEPVETISVAQPLADVVDGVTRLARRQP